MNNILFKLNEVRGRISLFKKEPILDGRDRTLQHALAILSDINIYESELTSSDFKQYRLEMLRCHVEIVSLFNKYYIENYKPQKPYLMHVFPPRGAVDEPVFGEVDPARIKDKAIREKYEADLEENIKLGREISFQTALASIKYALESPNKKVGSIATLELFIKVYYEDNSSDKAEVEKVINESDLKNDLKSKILNDTAS